jgi:hypothetical protein
MTDLDLNKLSTDELNNLQKKISKILERRAGGEVKKLRAQMLRLAKSMGYELVAKPEPIEVSEEVEEVEEEAEEEEEVEAQPRKRGRPKRGETAEADD